MKHFEAQNWVSVPQAATTEEAVQKLAEAGVVSDKPTRRRKAKPEPETASNPETATDTIPPPSTTYANTARDAADFLAACDEISYVYALKNWWRYDPATGWKSSSQQEMELAVAPFLRKQRAKLTQRTAADLVFALSSFCNLRLPDTTFDQTYVLEQIEGGLEAIHAPGWVSCQSHTLHVPTVARALFRGDTVPETGLHALESRLFTTGRIPCAFNPAATCPQWEAFVAEACPEDHDSLRQMFGLSLTYDRSYNAFFVVYGASGTGKSTCLNVLQRLNSGTVSQVSLARFGERFFIYPLSQNRLNVVHDMDSIYEGDGSVSLREAVLKSVCAGEPMEVERKHRSAQPELLRALCVFGTNTLPRFADKSAAIANRMRIIQFPTIFRNTPAQVRSLHDILYEELEGILIWALKGYGRLLETSVANLPETSSSAALKADTIKDSRPEIMFCDECLEPSPLVTTPTMTVYSAYAKYCRERGYFPSGLSRVIPAIVEYMQLEKPVQIRLDRRKYRALKGVQLAPTADFDPLE